jgi:hypothetical protein
MSLEHLAKEESKKLSKTAEVMYNKLKNQLEEGCC